MISINRKKIYKNSIAIGLIQILNVSITFMLVPGFIEYLDKKDYGLWLTVFSTITWINMLDIGVGNGLRNKLAQTFAVSDYYNSKMYIGSAISFFGLFCIFMFLFFQIILRVFDIGVLFSIGENINQFVELILISVLIDFVFKIVDAISFALQNSFLPKLRQALKNLFLMIVLYSLIFFDLDPFGDKLINLAYFNLGIVVIVNLIFVIVIFRKNLNILPSLNNISFKYFKPIAKMGLKFFIIQVSALVLFSTDNIIIINTLGPEYVTQYNIVFKMFTLFILIQGFLNSSLWSAYSAKKELNDWNWINKEFTRSLIFGLLIAILSIGIFVFGRLFLTIWLGDDSFFELSLIVYLFIYTLLRLWNSNFSTLFNGIGLLKVQVYPSVIGAVINIPLSVYFVNNLEMGLSGVVLGSIISLSIFSISAPFALRKLPQFKFNNKKL